MNKKHSYLLCLQCQEFVEPAVNSVVAFKEKHAKHRVIKESVDVNLHNMSASLLDMYFKSID